MSKFYFCVDVGGTNLKAGAVKKDGTIICTKYASTSAKLSEKSLAQSIMDLINGLCVDGKLSFADALGIGIGLPGLIDTANGVLRFSGNLKLKNYPIVGELQKLTTLPIKIANDADVGALAELKKGAGKNFENFIMLVVGTGIGGAIVAGKKLLASDYSGEIGHMKVLSDTQIKCSCGEVGCYETLASTSALVRDTKLAMQENPSSKLWEYYTPETVTGKTVFEMQDDETAKAVLGKFIARLGDGIVTLVNVFKPDAIIIGGAISNQKRKLLDPLETYVNNHIFARHAGFKVKIVPAEMTGDAGIVGARYLF